MEMGLMISPFVRRRETDHGVYRSICTICVKTVGLSSDPNILAIAEQAHNCRNGHQGYPDLDIFRDVDISKGNTRD